VTHPREETIITAKPIKITKARPNWGWGTKEPVPIFTEAEIRAACEDFGLRGIDTDSVIEQLKENRQR
jgi:hypothetical protein